MKPSFPRKRVHTMSAPPNPEREQELRLMKPVSGAPPINPISGASTKPDAVSQEAPASNSSTSVTVNANGAAAETPPMDVVNVALLATKEQAQKLATSYLLLVLFATVFYFTTSFFGFEGETVLHHYLNKTCNEQYNSGYYYVNAGVGLVYAVFVFLLMGVGFCALLATSSFLFQTLRSLLNTYITRARSLDHISVSCCGYRNYVLRNLEPPIHPNSNFPYSEVTLAYLLITKLSKVFAQMAMITLATLLVNLLHRNDDLEKEIQINCNDSFSRLIFVVISFLGDLSLHASAFVCFSMISSCCAYTAYRVSRIGAFDREPAREAEEASETGESSRSTNAQVVPVQANGNQGPPPKSKPITIAGRAFSTLNEKTPLLSRSL